MGKITKTVSWVLGSELNPHAETACSFSSPPERNRDRGYLPKYVPLPPLVGIWDSTAEAKKDQRESWCSHAFAV